MTWVRSSSCGGSSACVEVAFFGRCVNVRDSKHGLASPFQRWELWEWEELLTAIKSDACHPAVDWQFMASEGAVQLGMGYRHEPLRFTHAEWAAFVAGVDGREFEVDRLQAQSPSWSQPSSVSGPSDAPDGSGEAVASVCHDSGAAAAAGEGASNPPSPAALTDSPAGPDPLRGRALDEATGCATSPQSQARVSGQPGPDDARAAARAAVVARYEQEYLEVVVLDDFRAVLHSYADAAVDAFLTATLAASLRWGSGPLVQHVPDDSRPATGVVEGGDPVEGGAAVASTGGEVVPGPVGVPISSSPGATSSEGSSAGGWVADDPAEGGAGPVERTAGPAEGDAWFVADHECGWTRVES
jgi:hypothetical protein